MATSVIDQQTMPFTINIPKVDLKRFKGLAKAMGWTFEKVETSQLDYENHPSKELMQSLSDAHEGRVFHAESVEDLFRQCLGDDYVQG